MQHTCKEYIDYDHYIIMEQNETEDNSTEDIVPYWAWSLQ